MNTAAYLCVVAAIFVGFVLLEKFGIIARIFGNKKGKKSPSAAAPAPAPAASGASTNAEIDASAEEMQQRVQRVRQGSMRRAKHAASHASVPSSSAARAPAPMPHTTKQIVQSKKNDVRAPDPATIRPGAGARPEHDQRSMYGINMEERDSGLFKLSEFENDDAFGFLN